MAHKSKIMPAISPLFCNPLPSKTHTAANIDEAMLCDDTIMSYSFCVMFSVLMVSMCVTLYVCMY